MRPITIIGGGLAGLSLGIALRRRDVPVLIHEAGTYPRHRVCGEFINGVSGSTLTNLGIEDLLHDARSLSTTSWQLNNRTIFSGELDAPAKGISRFTLDKRLAIRFQELGGYVTTQSRHQISDDEGYVWAAGRRPDKSSRWIGLKVHVFDLQLASDLEMHLGNRGYVGLASVEGNRVNVCGLFERQEVTGRGVLLLHDYLFANGLDALQQRLETVEHDPRSFIGVSAFSLGPQESDESHCVLGDSAGMIPPFTGNGMSMAFEAAETATNWLTDYATGQKSWNESVHGIRNGLDDRFRTRLRAARMIHPFLLGERGRILLSALGRMGMLPFGPISRLLK